MMRNDNPAKRYLVFMDPDRVPDAKTLAGVKTLPHNEKYEKMTPKEAVQAHGKKVMRHQASVVTIKTRMIQVISNRHEMIVGERPENMQQGVVEDMAEIAVIDGVQCLPLLFFRKTGVRFDEGARKYRGPMPT